MARSNRTWADLAPVTATYSPSSYTVKATVVGPANQGPRPMVWSNQGGGLVPVDRSTYGTDETALVRGEISPATDTVRWHWTANEDTTIQSSDLSREIRVSRATPGTATLMLTAANPDGVQLGSASVSFTVAGTQTAAKLAPLRVVLSGAPTKLTVGDSAPVHAVVSGGRPPYRFAWSGDYQGEGAMTNLVALRVGSRKLSVLVTDASDKTAAAESVVAVEPKPIGLSFAADATVDDDKVVRVLPATPVRLTLKTQGGKAPFKVKWTGPAQADAANPLVATCQVDRPGTRIKVAAEVTDAVGARGELTIEVEAIESLLSIRR
jgi:hypothetical protein